VVDTNVLIAGLRRSGPAGAVLDAWVERRFQPCVSTALALEYEEVLVRKLGEARRESGLRALQALLARSEYVPVWFTYRPTSPDPADDLVVDCVVNSLYYLRTRHLNSTCMQGQTKIWSYLLSPFVAFPEFRHVHHPQKQCCFVVW